MKEYDQLAKYKTFSLGDVTAITGNESTSTSLITRWLKKKYVVRIRKDLYSCIDLTTGDIIANKYQIASAINDASYVSHHTAFEFFGMVNQVYNTVYVSSKKRFNTFEFMGTTYKYMSSPFYEGVFLVKNVEGIRITDVERTFVDSINLLSKVGGIEELINITKTIESLSAEKLLGYMEQYNKKVIFQKVGFFLENYYNGENLGAAFFETCQLKSGNSVRYLEQGREGKFLARWNLIIPEEFIPRKNDVEGPNEYI
ncbi:type IV toxin-antitoxin system AbiEi family antitoxin domain-containing protein [Petrocella atlantisensis]|nr:transcriptional regulator [Petrocella atlantisensis]